MNKILLVLILHASQSSSFSFFWGRESHQITAPAEERRVVSYFFWLKPPYIASCQGLGVSIELLPRHWQTVDLLGPVNNADSSMRCTWNIMRRQPGLALYRKVSYPLFVVRKPAPTVAGDRRAIHDLPLAAVAVGAWDGRLEYRPLTPISQSSYLELIYTLQNFMPNWTNWKQ